MATWAELDTRLLMLLGTATQSTAVQRVTFFNMAQEHFASEHTAKLQVADIEADGSEQNFELPDDYLDLYAVYSEDEEMFLEPRDFIPGVAWDNEASDDSNRPVGFLEWPYGSLYLFRAPAASTTALRVWYYGHWTEAVISEDDDTAEPEDVEVPSWAHEALLCYAAALTYISLLSDASVLNEYKTRVDSGRPTDNPFIDAHDTLMKRYEYLLSSRTKQIRVKSYRPGGRN